MECDALAAGPRSAERSVAAPDPGGHLNLELRAEGHVYVSVCWKVLDGPEDPAQIQLDVHRSFRDLRRCVLWPGTVLLAVRTLPQWQTLASDLQNIERAFTDQFAFAMFAHADREPFLSSEPFDIAAAKAITG
jgi:hypothetical protein